MSIDREDSNLSHTFLLNNPIIARNFQIPFSDSRPPSIFAIMHTTATAVLVLQLVLDYAQQPRCYGQTYPRNDPHVQRKGVCPASARRGGGLISYKCGGQGTTVTLDTKNLFTFSAPNVNSQVVIQCGGSGEENWFSCERGGSFPITLSPCSQVTVWSAIQV